MREADGADILRRRLEQDEAVRGLVQNTSRHPGDLYLYTYMFSPLAYRRLLFPVPCVQCGLPRTAADASQRQQLTDAPLLALNLHPQAPTVKLFRRGSGSHGQFIQYHAPL